MARKLRLLFEGAIYHVTFRGNARQEIFTDEADRRRLKERLAESAEDYGVRVYLYCFMSNHVHLLVETPQANLNAFMSSLLTGYTVYFNRRHRRVGHLLQGRYGAQVVEGDAHLLRLSRYIHLNPVHVQSWEKKSLRERREHLRGYRWSSYRGYAGLEAEESFISYGPLRAMVPGRGRAAVRYRRYVEEGLARTDDEFKALKEKSPLALGSESFSRVMQAKYKEMVGTQAKAEDVLLRRMGTGESPGKVLHEICDRLGVAADELKRKRRDGTVRAIVAYGLLRRGNLTQREVAERLGMSTGAAVSYLVRRLKDRMRTDCALSDRVREVLGDAS